MLHNKRIWLTAAGLLSMILLGGCSAVAERITALTPFGNAAARLVREGDALTDDGRISEAILAYRQAVVQNADYQPALARLGRAYVRQGRSRLGQRYLLRAATLGKGDQQLFDEAATLAAAESASAALPLAWQTAAGDTPPTGFSLKDGILYVAFEDGLVVAMDAANGSPIWSRRLPAGATSAPAVDDATLYVGSQDGGLYTFSRGDGSPGWSYPSKAPIYATPVITLDTVYCASGDGSLYALAVTDGALRWKFDTLGPIHASPAVSAGAVYFGSLDGRIYSLDALTGVRRWQYGIMTQGTVEGEPTIIGDRVFIGSGDGRLYALSAVSGGEYWRYSTADAIYARPLLAGNRLYVASNGQTLAAVDPMGGQLIWEQDLPGPITRAPALSGDTLYYALTADPLLYAADIATGKIRWQFNTGDWLAAGPIVAQAGGRELLFLGGKDGAILAFALQK